MTRVAAAAAADPQGGLACQGLARTLDALIDPVPPTWRPLLKAWRSGPDGQALSAFLDARRAAGAVIYPPQPFRALHATPLDHVRLVILGQDPYHGPGQAEGLAFSVPAGVKMPPSLRNVYLEIQRDLGLAPPPHGHLGHWAAQGVLLLNTCLTVEDGQPASHARMGWETLTDQIIAAVARRPQPAIFMLWGAHAQAKAALIEQVAPGLHLLLRANHPSPLSARRPPVPFLGCGHFGHPAVRALQIDWLGFA